MSNERELLKEALYVIGEYTEDAQERADILITNIKEILAQPEPEPVAWHYVYDDGERPPSSNITQSMPIGKNYTITPLYALTPKREPLSDATIAELWGDKFSGKTYMVKNFARAIEKAHGIGD